MKKALAVLSGILVTVALLVFLILFFENYYGEHKGAEAIFSAVSATVIVVFLYRKIAKKFNL